MPLDVNSVVVVAPAQAEMTSPDDADRLRAFIVPVLTAVVLHRGTWHWGPYPVGAESVTLLNVQGLRYREDNARVDLAAVGASVDIVTG
jgi:ureidoglycolate hydrolase